MKHQLITLKTMEIPWKYKKSQLFIFDDLPLDMIKTLCAKKKVESEKNK
jgi:hypothetical protein